MIKFEKDSRIRKEACWILSNISAGLEEHLNIFYNNREFIETLFNIMSSDEIEVQKEVFWIIANLTGTREIKKMISLLYNDIIYIISKWILNQNDFRIPALCLEALDNIFSIVIQSEDKLVLTKLRLDIDSSGLHKNIWLLEDNPNEIIKKKTEEFIIKYFSGTDSEFGSYFSYDVCEFSDIEMFSQDRDKDKFFPYNIKDEKLSGYSLLPHNNLYNNYSEDNEIGNIIQGMKSHENEYDKENQNDIAFLDENYDDLL
jgi:hypothetical protein